MYGPASDVVQSSLESMSMLSGPSNSNGRHQIRRPEVSPTAFQRQCSVCKAQCCTVAWRKSHLGGPLCTGTACRDPHLYISCSTLHVLGTHANITFLAYATVQQAICTYCVVPCTNVGINTS